MGIKVEMEHTKSKEKAEKIAKEHLAEHPDYYSRLKSAGLSAESFEAENKRLALEKAIEDWVKNNQPKSKSAARVKARILTEYSEDTSQKKVVDTSFGKRTIGVSYKERAKLFGKRYIGRNDIPEKGLVISVSPARKTKELARHLGGLGLIPRKVSYLNAWGYLIIPQNFFGAESEDYLEGVEKGIPMGYCEGCSHAYPLDAMNENGMCEECEGVLIGDIDWETDGEDPEEMGLPSSVTVPSDLEEDEIADYLSDEYGWLVNGFVVMGAESFEASQRKCSNCEQTGHNDRTCPNKIVPFSKSLYWSDKNYDGTDASGFPLVDASHVAMISKIVDGEVLKEPNSRANMPRITWNEEPITMTWGELDEKCKTQKLVSIGESTYSCAYLRDALAYLPKNTVLTLYTGYRYPLKATFEYGGEEWIFVLAPRVENNFAENFEAAVVSHFVPKTPLKKAMLNKAMMDKAEIEEAILDLETRVRLGLISEDEIMRKLHHRFGSEEEEFVSCPHCEGSGSIADPSTYLPATRDDPAEVDSMECPYCEGSGEVPEDEADEIPAYDWDDYRPNPDDRWDNYDRYEDRYDAEMITRTSYACSDCGREHQQKRSALECCFEGCFHNWELNRTKDWENGVFTMYVSCRKCGADSYIEGHADENSDSNPTPTFNAESFESDSWLTEGKCAICNSPSKFTVSTAVGERSFCCEACYADYMGLPVKEEGYYGLMAENDSKAFMVAGIAVLSALSIGIYKRWKS